MRQELPGKEGLMDCRGKSWVGSFNKYMNHIYPWSLCLWCQVLLAGAKVALYVHTKQLAGAMGVF